MKKQIAIFSSAINAYSETFVQSHKNINANIHFYFDGSIPKQLENNGYIFTKPTLLQRLLKSDINTLKLKALKKSLILNRIDKVLVEFGTNAARVYKLLNEMGIPYVVIFHGYDAFVYKVIEENKIAYKEIFDSAQCIIAVSLLMKDELINLGCPENKIIHSPCGPNSKFAHVDPKFTEKSFLSVGRFVSKKAHYLTILAFNEVLKKHPDAKLYLAGDGELIEACLNIVNSLKIKKNVCFLGVIDIDQHIELLNKCYGYVQHSITALNGDKEGTPVSILEASLAGIPVISTRHSGIMDVIIEGKTGYLVDEFDIDMMANKMIAILDNRNLAMDLGQKGKTFIKEKFSLNHHITAIEKALNI